MMNNPVRLPPPQPPPFSSKSVPFGEVVPVVVPGTNIYRALETALFDMRLAVERAWMVVVLATLIGPVYAADESEGVEPSVVK